MSEGQKHTPGPWRASETLAGTWMVSDFSSGAPVVVASGLPENYARLIAAAPEMYEGIGDFLAAYDRARIGDWDHGKLIDWLGEQVARLRPIHTKAEGR